MSVIKRNAGGGREREFVEIDRKGRVEEREREGGKIQRFTHSPFRACVLMPLYLAQICCPSASARTPRECPAR